MPDSFYMGIDLGTSSIRAVVFDVQGKPVLSRQEEFPMMTELESHAEIDPESIYRHFISVVRSCMLQLSGNMKVRAIGFSTQMHSLMLTDEKGKPLTRVMTWADNRAYQQAESIKKNYDSLSLYKRTGCIVQHPLYPLSKILWFKEQKPELFKQAACFLTVKSYLLYKLYGSYVIDYTDASASGLFNLHTFTWDEEIISQILGLSADRFPRPVPCDYLLSGISSSLAEEMCLDPDTPMTAGSGDGILANLGCGIFDASAMSSTVGTSGAVRTTVSSPLLDDQQRTWCYCLSKDRWVAGGAINNGGIVLRWLRDQFKETFQKDVEEQGCYNIYALFDQYAASIPAGSDQLTFLPLLTGERSPNWNALTRGVLYGLDLRHSRQHIVKAAMEGIMYQMFAVYQALFSINTQTRQIRASGGYARSDVWLQIQADIFGQPIAVSNVNEASALGAAYLSMLAVGAVSRFDEGLPEMTVTRHFEPDEHHREIYRNGYKRYADIYNRLYR